MKRNVRQLRGVITLALLVLGIWIELVYGEEKSPIIKKLGEDSYGNLMCSEDGRVYFGNNYNGELKVFGPDKNLTLSEDAPQNFKFSQANATRD